MRIGSFLRHAALGALGSSFIGCATLPPGDSAHDSFGGSSGRADGRYQDCELLEVIKLVNASTSTTDTLAAIVKTSSGGAAARNIVTHRDGPDGTLGTGDDDVIDDLNELDAIEYVGPMALDMLVGAVSNICTTDLSSRPFIDSQTFAQAPAWSWPRNGVELESVHGVSGISGRQLREVLFSSSGGRTVYDRIRKHRIMEAFTYEFAIDEMPWDSASHNAREGLPYLALSIENDRYRQDEDEPGEREISLGTDLMDDTYYDTFGYSLFLNDMLVRGRARWDTPTAVRRLLIASKFDTVVDDNGIKRNRKIDERNDNGMSFLASLDSDVRRGMTAWGGSDQPLAPLRATYEALQMENLLPDIAGRQDVLLLEPVAHLRSRRSRYHQNEASISAVERMYRNGEARVRDVLSLLQAAIDRGDVTGADANVASQLQSLAAGIADGSEVAMRTGSAATEYTFPMLGSASPSTRERLNRSRDAAESYSAAMHELAELVDDIDDAVVAEPTDDNAEDNAEMFRAWRISLNTALAAKRVAAPFLAEYQTLGASGVDAFNTYGAAQRAANSDDFEDFEALDAAAWTEVGLQLGRENLDEVRRQIEAGGTSALTLWFDGARRFYVPNSRRVTSNFMIDTFDMTEILTPQEWNSIPTAERDFNHTLPAAKVLHTLLVNELQIELGSETEYVSRIDALTTAIAAGDTSAETAATLEGAKFVFTQYVQAMAYLAEMKGERVLDMLRDAGAPADIAWEPTERAKGETAISLLAEML